MQKLFNTKNKLFITLFVSLTTSGIQATNQINEPVTSESINSQLTFLLKTMSTEDQRQFKKLLKEVDDAINNASTDKKSQDPSLIKKLFKQIKDILDIVPYGSNIAEISFYLALAVVWWDFVQPKVKELLPGWETASELPKAVGSVFIIDRIKDIMKEWKQSAEQKVFIDDESLELMEVIA